MSHITSKKEYLELYSGNQTKSKKHIDALNHALDIRKFEIELYWKRAAYFWTFIAAAFAGYFLLSKTNSEKFESIYLVSCLGFVFSVGWYLVNRGSKAWHKNWETHVDLLEDVVIGPLYKTSLNRDKYRFLNFTDPFPISVSKINQILSLFVASVWFFLILHSLIHFDCPDLSNLFAFAFLSSITIIIMIMFACFGKTTKSKNKIKVDLFMREYEE
jgi:hypothetical protein